MSPVWNFPNFRWTEALHRLRDYTKQESYAFCTEQFRFLLEQIMRFTPPKDQAQGRKRVVTDIGRVFRPVAEETMRDKRIREIVRAGDLRAFEAFARKSNLKLLPARFDPEVVRKRRDSRGRVARGSRPFVVIGREDPKALAAFLRRKQAHVGMARSGWLAALLRVGGAAPMWVLRHTADRGDVIDERGDPRAPGLIAINRTPWAARKDEGERIIRAAMQSRAVRVEAALRTAIRLAGRRAGFAA